MALKIIFAFSYACIFWFVCSRRPIIALAFSFAFSPFAVSILGTSVNASLSDINIALCLPLLLIGNKKFVRKFSIGPLTAPVWFYLTVCFISSIVADQWYGALLSWFQMLLYLVVTVIVFASLCKPKELALIPYYAVGVGVIWGITGLATGFNFMGAGKNAFGASLAGVLVIIYSLYVSWQNRPQNSRIKSEGKYLGIAGILVFSTLLLTVSRGGCLGAIVAVIVMSVYARSYQLLSKICVILIPVIAIIWISLPPKIKFYVFNFDSSSAYNIKLRYGSLQLAESLFSQDPLWGSGLGLRKVYDATNVVWSTLAESGIVGLLAFASIFFVFYRWTWNLRKVIRPNDPYFMFVNMGVGLMTSRIVHGMVDHYWSRGVITMVWASVGMILCLSRAYASKPARLSVPQEEQPLPSGRTPQNGRLRRVPSRRSSLRRVP